MPNTWEMIPKNQRPPIPLRNAIDLAELCRGDPCESNVVLGSYWLGSRRSFESRLVKVFKACVPTREFEPHSSQLCRFYADLILERSRGTRFDWVVRVLGSAENEVDPSRPLSLLVDMLCSNTGARNATDMFFKSGSRPPMRGVRQLAGAEALKVRLAYVAQDLFIRPGKLPGRVLLIDDICNTGASTRLYASALKELTGASSVLALNLAATRFARGRDGRGMLQLDVSGLAHRASLAQVWTDTTGTMHLSEDCPSAVAPVSCDVRFMAERKAGPCPNCAPNPAAARKWWRIW